MASEGGPNILVVDDDPNLRNLITEILKLENLSFDVATTGKEAFSLAVQKDYDLILMDIKMPEWDGVTAIRSLDFVQKIQKVLVVSAYLDTALLRELKSEPLVIGWLEKPFDPTTLINTIREALRKRIDGSGRNNTGAMS